MRGTMGPESLKETLSIVKDELKTKQDKLVGKQGQVVGFDENGEAQAQDFSGEGWIGTNDHTQLINRNVENQHNISSITGLEEALSNIPIPMTADELRKILINGGN